MNIPLTIKTSALVTVLSLTSLVSFSQNSPISNNGFKSHQPSSYELKSSIANFCKSVVKKRKSDSQPIISNKYLRTYSVGGTYYSDSITIMYVDKVPFGKFGKGDLLMIKGKNVDVVDYSLDAILKSSSEEFRILDFNYSKNPSNDLIKQSHDGELYFQYYDLMKNIKL